MNISDPYDTDKVGQMQQQRPLFTTKEAAKYLCITVKSVTRMIKEKKLGAYKVGSKYRISEEDLEKYLKNTHTINGETR